MAKKVDLREEYKIEYGIPAWNEVTECYRIGYVIWLEKKVDEFVDVLNEAVYGPSYNDPSYNEPSYNDPSYNKGE